MRRLRSNLDGLRSSWEAGLTAEFIAEPLISRADSDNAADVKDFMQSREFDAIGVKESEGNDHRVTGYVLVSDLGKSNCGKYRREFSIDEVVSVHTPLRECLPLMHDRQRLFVLGRRGIDAIITLADLQKQPVRMMLFGLVSLLETALVHLVRKYYPNNEWKKSLTQNRIKNAEKLYRERCRKNQNIDLADCLQLCDKFNILHKSDDFFMKWGFTSKKEAKVFLNQLQSMRNNLAHSLDLVSGSDWKKVIAIFNRAESVLDICFDLLEEKEKGA